MRRMRQRGVSRRLFPRGRKRSYTEPMATYQRARGQKKVPLSEVFAQCAGNWVAVDRVTGEPRAAARTADELAAHLRSHQIRNVSMVRAPDPSEPEMVGLG